jgi:NAD(P)-dependent dehydrogenase (short-subunit alcohol dehydrogenase family)
MDLENKKAVIIGASSGMGLEIARRLSGAGADVIATGRDGRKLEAAIAGIANPKGRISGAILDASDRSALDRFFANTGSFDHLVLALSGGEGAGELAQLDLKSLRRGFEEKFWPQIEAAQAALPTLRAGGSITFITAISARIANPGTAGLGAINGAIESMVGTLARELKPCRVNAVSPGVVDTPWWDRLPAEAKSKLFRQQTEILPVGRVGLPQEIAHAVQFLVENTFTTGIVVPCDGGLHLL